jgi:hypothetical protein
MHWLSIMPVTHALKPTFQNKLSHFFGHSSRLEKLDATNPQTTTEPVGREALATNQRTINRTGGALQPLSEASTAIA